MSYLTANMKMITECADKLAHLGEKLFNETEMKTIKIGIDYFFELPEGYQFVDENGNVINATKIILEKKKKEYPKTYEECCKVLKDDRDRFFNFLSLVKRMREAQEAFQNAISSEDIDQMDMCQIRMLDLEREVDEYLKKLEKQ